MARLWTSGFEHNSLTTELTNTNGSPTLSSTTKRTGSYALRINPSAIVQKALFQYSAAGSTKQYFRVYIYIASAPSAETNLLFTANDLDACWRIACTTGLALKLYDGQSGGTQKGSNSAALSLNTWYRIELAVDSTTLSADSATAYIDGTSFATGTANHTTIGKGFYFNIGSAVSATVDFYADDVAINDDSGSYQNGLPGAGSVVQLKPDAAGDVNTFATQTGGTAGSANNYTRVNEVTPDDATTYNGSSTLNQEDMFSVANAGLGSSDTINVVHVESRFRNSTADTAAAFKLQLKKTSGGTVSQSAGIVPNSTTWRTNAVALPLLAPITAYVDPDAGAWTNSTIDSMQIGYKLTTAPATSGRRVDISNVWATVDYTASSSTNLVVADIATTPTLEAPALTQANTLTVANVGTTPTLETPSLTQANSLVVADVSTTPTLEAPTLSVAITLTVADLSTAPTLESPALTQASTLTVADLSTTPTLNTLTLEYSQLLTVSDISVASTLDVTSLTQAHSLTVADVSIATFIDATHAVVPSTDSPIVIPLIISAQKQLTLTVTRERTAIQLQVKPPVNTTIQQPTAITVTATQKASKLASIKKTVSVVRQ